MLSTIFRFLHQCTCKTALKNYTRFSANVYKHVIFHGKIQNLEQKIIFFAQFKPLYYVGKKKVTAIML